MIPRAPLSLAVCLGIASLTAQVESPRQRSGGLHGYIGVRIEAPPPEFGFGASYHATAWPLTPTPLDGFQIGLPSTWIVPDNHGYQEPLCPKGTVARDHWPERGPSYGSVFQTIEGGLGFWVSTRFPSSIPKYRMNGTPNCYSHEVSSPGFGFGRLEPLSREQLALAQVSNRLVVPPDGLTLQPGTGQELIGSAWMALPWIERRGPHRLLLAGPARTLCFAVDENGTRIMSAPGATPRDVWNLIPDAEGTLQVRLAVDPSISYGKESDRWILLHDPEGDLLLRAREGVGSSDESDAVKSRVVVEPVMHGDRAPTGDLAWTFFLDADNFRGPVAFWIPGAWSAIADGYPPAAGRTLDCRAGEMGSGAMEVNTVPMFEARSADGRRFTKLPRISWPVDEHGHSWLMQDVRFYAQHALADRVRAWFHGGPITDGSFLAEGTKSMPAHANQLRLGQRIDDKELPLAGLDARARVEVLDGAECAYGITWHGEDRGALPEYFVEKDGALHPVAPRDVPTETGLLEARFRPATRGHAYLSPKEPESGWTEPGPTAGPFTMQLGDGSEVEYCWFRFVDQPALRRFPWSDAERAELQRRVELIHRNWKIDGSYLAPISRGHLASIEPQQIVTPPSGLEVGYVPIVTAQRDRKAR